MQQGNTKSRPEDNDESMVLLGMEQWPEDLKERISRLLPASYAKKHADTLLRGIGEFKVRLNRILDGHDEYLRRKNDGTEESSVDRIYQG